MQRRSAAKEGSYRRAAHGQRTRRHYRAERCVPHKASGGRPPGAAARPVTGRRNSTNSAIETPLKKTTRAAPPTLFRKRGLILRIPSQPPNDILIRQPTSGRAVL